jgi:hypothetical protein
VEIVTVEGDRVTLSASSEVTANVSTYERSGHGHRHPGRAHLDRFSFQSSGQISVSVEGDLSKDELRDITKALSTIEKLSTDLQAGCITPAIAHVQQIVTLDSLATLDAKLEVQQSFEVSQQSVSQETGGAAPTSPEALQGAA